MNRFQFRIRDLMGCAAIISVALGLVINEPAEIAFAALVCVASSWILATLLMYSWFDFWSKIKAAIGYRSVRPLIGRIKWLIFDTILFMWMLVIISISNYVFDNNLYRAHWLIILGALTSPVFAWFFTTWTDRFGSWNSSDHDGGTK